MTQREWKRLQTTIYNLYGRPHGTDRHSTRKINEVTIAVSVDRHSEMTEEAAVQMVFEAMQDWEAKHSKPAQADLFDGVQPVAEDATTERPARTEINDEDVILLRLLSGDAIGYSRDGDMAFFKQGDRAFIGDAIMSLHDKGFLCERSPGEGESYEGCYDTVISQAGKDYLASLVAA